MQYELVDSKFPRKPGEPRMHEQWISGAPDFFSSSRECVYVYACVQKEGIWDSHLMHSCCIHKPLPLPIQSCSYNGQCMGNKLQEISMWCRFRYGTWGLRLYNDCLANDLGAVMRSVKSSISMYTHLKRSFSMMFCY